MLQNFFQNLKERIKNSVGSTSQNERSQTNMLMPQTGILRKEAHTLGWLDYTCAASGYVTAQYTGDPSKRCKLRIEKDGQLQTFDVVNPAIYKAYPLCFGAGTYKVSMYQQVSGTSYRTILSETLYVNMTIDRGPFLVPTTYALYNVNSKCVETANYLCRPLPKSIDKVNAVYRWILDNTEYDYDLAKKVQTENWWLPDPDEVIRDKKTICFGYSSLFAAMCRSQGIATKVVVGPISGTGMHAWNEVYIQDSGTVDGIDFDSNKWNMVDLTFMDSGKSSNSVRKFVTDSKNYKVDYVG